ncbi:DUF6093 family protein [Streptomyces olivaceiscleroticus]|uniref:Uncharacterized protein n=1 Tax=Streptomyces olivaceiscleroticus TaxID=68245 RepID=A0ABP3LJB9_9ACTN
MAGLDLSGVVGVVADLLLQDTVRISRPGAGTPVFDPATGEYTYPPADILYEGLGAVQVSGTPGGVTAIPIPSQPWVDETNSRYRLFTPLTAPIADRGMVVEVLAVHLRGDSGLLGRQWRVQDPGVAGTLSVVRITGLDQIQQDAEGAA